MQMIMGGEAIKTVSIYELLHTELHCAKTPSNGKIYPEGFQPLYQVRGILLDAEVSSYQQMNPFSDFQPRLGGALLGYFMVTGVIKEGEDILAFRYSANVNLPYDVDQNYQKEIEQNLRHFIESEREGRFAEYVHLRAALKGADKTDKIITLEGAVRNSSPRLFLPQGMMIEAGAFRTQHGSIHAEKNHPIYR